MIQILRASLSVDSQPPTPLIELIEPHLRTSRNARVSPHHHPALAPRRPFHGRVSRRRTSCPPPSADSTRPSPSAPREAGAVGSALLLGSATAGFTLAAHVERLGPRRLARAGLLLAAAGYGTAALTTALPAVVAGAVLGGFGSGTATAVAATGIAARRDPHRVSTLGLLSVSALAGALYLTIPHLGPGHGLPLAALALTAACSSWPGDRPARRARRPPPRSARRNGPAAPPPRRSDVLAVTLLCGPWRRTRSGASAAGSALTQAGLSEVTVGAVFATALGAGLLGVIGGECAGRALRPRAPHRRRHGAHRRLYRAHRHRDRPADLRDGRDRLEHALPGRPVVPHRPRRLPRPARPLGGPRRLRVLARHGAPARSSAVCCPRTPVTRRWARSWPCGLSSSRRPMTGGGPAHGHVPTTAHAPLRRLSTVEPTDATAVPPGGLSPRQRARRRTRPTSNSYASTSARYRARRSSSCSRNDATKELRASSRSRSSPRPSACRTASKLSPA